MNEKEILIKQIFGIVFREVGEIDDCGCDWFTVGENVYIGDVDWLVCSNDEVAQCKGVVIYGS